MNAAYFEEKYPWCFTPEYRQNTVLHESAHCVFYELLCNGIDLVSIVPEEYEVESADGFSLARVHERPCREPVNQIAALMAGVEGAKRLNPDFYFSFELDCMCGASREDECGCGWSDGGETDREQINDILKSMPPEQAIRSRADAESLVKRMLVDPKVLKAIEKIAATLLVKKTLSGRTVRTIIARYGLGKLAA